MKQRIDWNRRTYLQGATIEEYCRNEDCGWRITRNSRTGFTELETCPLCGAETDISILFGGMVLHYNRVKDNFTFTDRQNRFSSIYIDCGDCPDTILFMLKHYRFDGWSERAIKEGEL